MLHAFHGVKLPSYGLTTFFRTMVVVFLRLALRRCVGLFTAFTTAERGTNQFDLTSQVRPHATHDSVLRNSTKMGNRAR